MSYENKTLAELSLEDTIREKNNRVLASCIRAKGITNESTEDILRFTETLQTWQRIASYVQIFEDLGNEDRKTILKNHLSFSAYGKAVENAYYYFAQNMSGPTVKREFLHLYSAVNQVALSTVSGAPQVPGIAEALCELLEFENEQPNTDTDILKVYIKPNGEYESGIYYYNIKERTLEFHSKKR